jgi:glycosyltransferase involved in cell wall biosynthesis
MKITLSVSEKKRIDVKQRIAFVIDSLNIGGAEKFLITIVNSFVKKGYEPYVILLNDSNALLSELDPEIQVEIFIRRFKYDINVSNRIKAFLYKEGIYKVFCIDPYSFFMARWSFFFDRNISVYLSLHHTLPKSFKRFLLNFTYFKFLKKTDIVVYICQNQKAYFKKKYYINQQESYVIYNGIDSDYFSPSSLNKYLNCNKDMWRANLGLNSADKVILKVAAFRPEKKHTHAVEALGILHQKHKLAAHLVFVGSKKSDDAYIIELKELASRCGVAEYLHIIPSQADVRPYYMLADIFTLTSHTTETFSLSALEAMSFGLPCSLTEIGGASEMIEVNKTGALSKPGDSTSIAASWNMLLSKEFNKEYIRQRVIDNFSAENMIAQYETILS